MPRNEVEEMGEQEKREHDDCKENQIAKLGILVAFSVCVRDFPKPCHTIHNPPTLLHADAYFSGVQSLSHTVCELHTKYSTSMRATISNLTTTIFPHFDLLPLLALMLSATKVGVCACGYLSLSPRVCVFMYEFVKHITDHFVSLIAAVAVVAAAATSAPFYYQLQIPFVLLSSRTPPSRCSATVH